MTIIYKVLRKTLNGYFSCHRPSKEYFFQKNNSTVRKGLLKGIWCFRSKKRALRALEHLAEKYDIDIRELVIIKGIASLKNHQRRTGGIYIVESVILEGEIE